jgi:hypothetical protein
MSSTATTGASASERWQRLRAGAPGLNPLAVRGTPLPPNVLLAAKLVTLVFLVKGLWRLTDPYLPYVHFLGDLASPHVFQHTLQIVWLVAAACLFLNRFVRVSCAVLGGAILVAVLASDAYRTNNLTFSALLLILIGLSDRKTASTIIRAQLVVLYFWAGLNKLLDANWRSGAFFETWNSIQGYGHVYRTLASALPGMTVSAIASWGVIITELFLGVAFAVRRLVLPGILVLIVYHSSLLLITGSTFTTFWFALLAACLALLRWPSDRPVVHYGVDRRYGWTCNVLRALDLGRALRWEPQPGSTLRTVVGERSFTGGEALARVLLYHPTLYVVFYVLAALPQPQDRWAALVVFAGTGYAVLAAIRSRVSPRVRAEA